MLRIAKDHDRETAKALKTFVQSLSDTELQNLVRETPRKKASARRAK
jgi:hypothetical protein